MYVFIYVSLFVCIYVCRHANTCMFAYSCMHICPQIPDSSLMYVNVFVHVLLHCFRLHRRLGSTIQSELSGQQFPLLLWNASTSRFLLVDIPVLVRSLNLSALPVAMEQAETFSSTLPSRAKQNLSVSCLLGC